MQIQLLNTLIPHNNLLEQRELDTLYANYYSDTDEIRFVFDKVKPLDEPYKYHAKLFKVYRRDVVIEYKYFLKICEFF